MTGLLPVDNPFSADLAELSADKVALYGVGVDANSSHLAGSAAAPAAIRAQLHCGSANYSNESGVDVSQRLVDVGDITVANTAASEDDANLITTAVTTILDTGAAPLGLGGDHSVTYPILRALAAKHPGLTVVHVDAHPDTYDNFGDNRLSHASPFARVMEDGLCTRLIQLGIRTANQHQREQAERFGIETVEARAFASFNPATVTGPIYVSVDLDGLDPAFAPGVSHHEPGGLTSRQLFDLIAALPGPLVGADVVELNPQRDVMDMTAMVGAKLVRELAARLAR